MVISRSVDHDVLLRHGDGSWSPRPERPSGALVPARSPCAWSDLRGPRLPRRAAGEEEVGNVVESWSPRPERPSCAPVPARPSGARSDRRGPRLPRRAAVEEEEGDDPIDHDLLRPGLRRSPGWSPSSWLLLPRASCLRLDAGATLQVVPWHLGARLRPRLRRYHLRGRRVDRLPPRPAPGRFRGRRSPAARRHLGLNSDASCRRGLRRASAPRVHARRRTCVV